MNKNKSSNIIIAVIPARGGSKGVPHKNIKLLAGKPLIGHTIEAALKSTFLDRVIVSTDGEEVAKLARELGAEVPFMRPKYLATDTATTVSVLQHVVNYLENDENYYPNIIVTLQPTSPFRTTEDIDNCINKMLNSRSDSIVSLVEVEQHPYWMKCLNGDKVCPFISTEREYSRRQDLPLVYILNGAVYVTRRDVLMNENMIMGHDTRAVVMDKNKSIDIDTLNDFLLAEIVISNNIRGIK